MEITKHLIDKNGIETWEVINPRGYSARWGDVTLKKDGTLDCKCIQFERYGTNGNGCAHTKHIDNHLINVEKRADYRELQAAKWGYK